MQHTKFNNKPSFLRQCIFYVILGFSVFAFTGFNLQAQIETDQSNLIELVDVNIDQLENTCDKFQPYLTQALPPKIVLVNRAYDKYALQNTNKQVLSRFSLIEKKSLLYDSDIFFFPFKVSLSSDDDDPLLFLS